MLFVLGVPISTSALALVSDLRVLAQAEGVPLFSEIQDTGEDIMFTCPFHKGGRERKPSCGMAKTDRERLGRKVEAGTVHCFTCGYKGDLGRFVSDVLGLDGTMAGFQWLMGRYGLSSGNRERLDLFMERGERGEHASMEHVDVYEDERAYAYLESRGIPRGVAQAFGVMYSPARDAVAMPVRSRDGYIVFYKERGLSRKDFYNAKGAIKAGQVFGLFEARKVCPKGDRRLYICESEIDALSLWSWGELAVAIMGSSISDSQARLLELSPFRTIIAGLDNDEAGRKGNSLLKSTLIRQGFRVYNVDWEAISGSPAKDWNEMGENLFHSLRYF